MRTIDLLGKILGQGCHAEILENTAAGLLLVVKAENRLTSSVGTMIRNEGFRFRYCYSETNGKTVIIFSRSSNNDHMSKNILEAGHPGVIT